MQRKIPFVNNEYYHIYNRGVEKRNIFLKDFDYVRFLRQMEEFNTPGQIINLGRTLKKDLNEAKPPLNEAKPPSPPSKKGVGEKKLTEIICYSLMPNHFHFILRQLVDGGISKFMQKLGTGYTMYFNTKYKRNGVLFQGVFKDRHIDNDNYLLHLSRYVHLNCLGIICPDWKEKGIRNKKEAVNFLKTYKWSSFPFYLNTQKPCLIKLIPDIVINQFNGVEDYEKFVVSWKEDDLNTINDLVSE